MGFERWKQGQRWEWLGSERNVGQELLHCCLCYYFRCYDSRSSSDAIPKWLLSLTLLFPSSFPSPDRWLQGKYPINLPPGVVPTLLPAVPTDGPSPAGPWSLLRGPGPPEALASEAVIEADQGGAGLEDEAKASLATMPPGAGTLRGD